MRTVFNGERFKGLIVAKGVSLTSIAETMGVSLNTVSTWCNGTHCPPNRFRNALLMAGYSLEEVNNLTLSDFYKPEAQLNTDSDVSPVAFYSTALMLGYEDEEIRRLTFGDAYR